MPRSKGDLPTKACQTCGRPFAWRKKWARDWENVKYCSDACRIVGKQVPKGEEPRNKALGPGLDGLPGSG